MLARIGIAVAALLLAAAAPPQSADQASVDEENARARQEAIDAQLSAAATLMRGNNMSEKGIAIVVEGLRAEQDEQFRIFQRGAEQDAAIRKAADARPFSAGDFEAALKRYRDNWSGAVLSAMDAEVKIFEALGPQDQRVYARLMHTSNPRLGIPARPLGIRH
jgi:type II secretory pathway pseudopilin PulG